MVGEIPKSIGKIDSLEVMHLARNLLNGTIPFNLGFCPSLKYLNLASNNLSGEIPASLSNATSLEFLGLGSNLLSGEFPMPLFELFDGKLQDLKLYKNNLTGNITINEIKELKRFKSWSVERLIRWIKPKILNRNEHLQLVLEDGKITRDGD